MSALCLEKLPFSTTPRLAMDAALPDDGTSTSKLIRALHAFAANLPSDQKSQLETLIESNTDPTAAVADNALNPQPEDVERAVALLRSNGVDEDLIGKVCAACGAAVPTAAATQAQDAAVRARHARSYAARFPGHVGGDAKLPSPSSAKSYAERFPDAARIKFAY